MSSEMSDSIKKYQENEDNNPSLSAGVMSSNEIFKAKIQYQIKSLLYRKLSAQEEIADLTRCIDNNSSDYDYLFMWRARIAVLKDQVEHYKVQIEAYENNNHKAKIIPDRCL